MRTADDIATAIRFLPISATRLVTLVAAVAAYAHKCNLAGDTTDVEAHLLDALGAADSVRSWDVLLEGERLCQET